MLENNYQNLNTSDKYTIDNENILVCNINIPIYTSKMFAQSVLKINQYYSLKQSKLNIDIMNSMLPKAKESYYQNKSDNVPIRSYENTLNYTVTLNEPCVISLFFDEYTYEGGANGYTLRTSDTFNLEKEMKLSLKDVVKCRNPKRYVLTEIISQLDENESNSYSSEEIIKHFDSDNFYLTENNLVIYFQQGEIGPMSDGVVEFMLPYDETIVKPTCTPVLYK